MRTTWLVSHSIFLNNTKMITPYSMFFKIFLLCPLNLKSIGSIKLNILLSIIASLLVSLLCIVNCKERFSYQTNEPGLYRGSELFIVAFKAMLTCYNIVSSQLFCESWRRLFKPSFDNRVEPKRCLYNFIIMLVLFCFVSAGTVISAKLSIIRVISGYLIDIVTEFLFFLNISSISSYGYCLQTDIIELQKSFEEIRKQLIKYKHDLSFVVKIKVIPEGNRNLKIVIAVFRRINAFNAIFGLRTLGISTYCLLHLTRLVIITLEHTNLPDVEEKFYMTLHAIGTTSVSFFL